MFIYFILGIDSGFLLMWYIGHSIGVTRSRRVSAHWVSLGIIGDSQKYFLVLDLGIVKGPPPNHRV